MQINDAGCGQGVEMCKNEQKASATIEESTEKYQGTQMPDLGCTTEMSVFTPAETRGVRVQA
jgi:hypothetical protein